MRSTSLPKVVSLASAFPMTRSTFLHSSDDTLRSGSHNPAGWRSPNGERRELGIAHLFYRAFQRLGPLAYRAGGSIASTVQTIIPAAFIGRA